MTTEYGKRLKLARQHAKLTQMELSAKTGIRQSTISSAEVRGQGSRETPIYAKSCGVDVMWLTTGEGEMLGSTTANAPTATLATSLEPAYVELIKGLSHEALSLAHLFEMLPNDRIQRMITLTEASAVILQALQPNKTTVHRSEL